MKFSRISSPLLAGVGAAGLLVALAAPAAAHVTVQPPEAEVGGYTKLTFRVPNESDSAGTVELEVSFPEDTPFGSARVKPRAGWTAEVEKEKLPEPVEIGHSEVTEAVRSITWTADDGVRIGPGEFDEFEVAVGPLPDTDRLEFPAVQTYEDGEVVAWDQSTEGEAEPERPAPTLLLHAAGADSHDHGSGDGDQGNAATVSNSTDGAAGSDAVAAQGSDDTARALGTAGLVVGFLGLLVGAFGLVMARRRAQSAGSE